MRYAPHPVEISRWQAPKPAQNVQILSARLPRSGMAFTSEQLLVANSLQLDFNGSGWICRKFLFMSFFDAVSG